ncbi:hypothetical protein ES705_14263 [subsurface metagenome]
MSINKNSSVKYTSFKGCNNIKNKIIKVKYFYKKGFFMDIRQGTLEPEGFLFFCCFLKILSVN